jgi:imidazolonepropionase
VRAGLDEGLAVALASGYRTTGPACFNPQYLLYLAKERFGLTDEEAIVAATWNAACSLRMSHVTGSLDPGKHADLLVMDVPDYRDLARRPGHNDVLFAVRGGHVMPPRGLSLD